MSGFTAAAPMMEPGQVACRWAYFLDSGEVDRNKVDRKPAFVVVVGNRDLAEPVRRRAWVHTAAVDRKRVADTDPRRAAFVRRSSAVGHMVASSVVERVEGRPQVCRMPVADKHFEAADYIAEMPPAARTAVVARPMHCTLHRGFDSGSGSRSEDSHNTVEPLLPCLAL